MGELLNGVSIAIVELFAMLIMWIGIVSAVVTIAGIACLGISAAIRFAIRELRAKGLSQNPAPYMQETPSAL